MNDISLRGWRVLASAILAGSSGASDHVGELLCRACVSICVSPERISPNNGVRRFHVGSKAKEVIAIIRTVVLVINSGFEPPQSDI